MSTKKNKKPIKERKWYLLIIFVALLMFFCFPFWTLIVICVIAGIVSSWYDLDDIGKMGRNHPIWTTIILFTLGCGLYLWIYKYGLLWKQEYYQKTWVELLANISNGEVVESKMDYSIIALFRKAIVMIISTPASIYNGLIKLYS